ncbi:hypothetical protein [Actinophytocola oryzae]|uniref:hypothetical protein n=1 Tax=Actinophytocola oryzae TaxID=502181 RepID=UPI001063E7AF|nr:hypothetical protein [Actinophytocola oryzae]
MSELDVLLETAGKRGYLWHMFRVDGHGPEVLAGVLQHEGCADVFVLSGIGNAHAYRVPTCMDTDVFAPTRVFWWYCATPVWTLRAVLTLRAPGELGALIQAPAGLGVPGDRMPVRIRRRT